tara:strand:- start:11274 stop:13010 length:1737 start_codon:yes stop_codon:yes gene_type:complete
MRNLLSDDDWQNLDELIAQWPNDIRDYRAMTLRRRRSNKSPWIVAYIRPGHNNTWEAMVSSLDSHLTEDGSLFRSKERLELVLEGTRLGMWDWNPQTNEVHFDQRWAEMLGYDITEIEMKLDSWQSRVHPDDLAACFEDIQAHMDGRRDFYENIHRMKHRDGHWVYILDRGRIVEWDEDGKPVRFTGTHTDISREKNAQMAAAEASRAKSIFLASMSHELRTPIHGMLGMAELLDRGVSKAEQSQYLAYIQDAGKSLLRLISDILDVSRFETNSIDIRPSDFALRKHLEDTVELHRKQFNEKGITLELEIEEDTSQYIRADPIRLRQIISNLINNALKFTARGEVRVQARTLSVDESQYDLMISVMDTGEGIHAEHLDQIFDLFVQAPESRSELHEGVGLGLSICKSLVEKMGGSIEASSEVGSGSRFSFKIPVTEVSSVTEPVRNPVSDFSGANLKILVVEDSDLNQVLVRRFLQYLGLDCEIVDSGPDALDRVRSDNLNLVFMDLGIPGMGGLETTRQIRKLDIRQPHIIALTADAFIETREECLEAGMNQFLSKPFNLHQLSDALGVAVEGLFSA